MKEQEYETSVLLHWNAEKQQEETWLYIGFPRGSWVTVGKVLAAATKGLNRKPQVIMSANSYLWNDEASTSYQVIDWLAGPITEEEASTL